MSHSNDNHNATNPVLEPTSSGLQQTLQIVKPKKNKAPPTICAPVSNNSLLARVRSFLPEMEKAEAELKTRMDAGDSVDIEDVSSDGRHIEMNVGVLNATEGTSDSDSDSSESHEDANNEFTSDSDLDSSSTTGSSSSSATSKLKMPGDKKGKKRPLIQVMEANLPIENSNSGDNPNDESKHSKTN